MAESAPSLVEIKDLVDKGNREIEAARKLAEEAKSSADAIKQDELAKATADVAAKLDQEAKALADRLGALEAAANRPGDPADGKEGKGERSEYDKKFLGYLRGSVSDTELKAMSTDVDPQGGFLVVPTMVEGIMRRLRRTSPMRSVAAAYAGDSVELLIERGDAGFEWTGETTPRNETDTPTINKVMIPTHEMSAKAPVSQRTLDNATLDVEGFLTGQIEDRFRRAENTAFIVGEGVFTPKGITVYPTSVAPDESRANATLQHVKTGKNGGFPDLNTTTGVSGADPIIKVFYELQPEYQANATWMMKNTTAAAVALLKNGDGTYLVNQVMNADGTVVRTLQGRPIALANDMPELANGSLSIAVGDFSRGYAVVDNASLRLLRDPYTRKPMVLFYMTRRVGGGCVDFDAIKFLKFSA